MRASKIVNAKDLRHAASELLLIVVGILIALAISDWHDRNLQREQEFALLGEIRTALAVDLETLEVSLQGWMDTADRIEALIDILKREPPYEPSFAELFAAPYGFRPVKLNTAAYESLKSVGLQTISNPDLRLSIAKVFDEHYESLTMVNEVDVYVAEVMRPYYLEHFFDLKFLESATPLDYEAVIKDTYFENIALYRLNVISANQIGSYTGAIEIMQATMKMLDKELDQ